ncbi:MAG: Enoyl-CoA hydratase/isomerase [Frankiales bacterium]|nr:Enoyl-CoA hydratase/isomerase [Frankiales bacterium]
MTAVRVERHGRVLVITMDRPQARNAMDRAMAYDIAAALDLLDVDDGLTVGVLTGAGGTFSSGMDLKAFLATGERPEVEGRGLAGLTLTPPAKPLVAAVEGWAVAGGCELALACDLVVAAEDAQFGLPEVKRGLIAGSGGLLRMARRVPPGIAMEHALTGDPLSAVEAHRWGLVNRLTPPGGALSGALALASSVAANGPLAVRTSKALVAGAVDSTGDGAWERQNALLAVVLASQDAQEGAAAFVEKRPPVWTGR